MLARLRRGRIRPREGLGCPLIRGTCDPLKERKEEGGRRGGQGRESGEILSRDAV